jgi:hypothetical protein
LIALVAGGSLKAGRRIEANLMDFDLFNRLGNGFHCHYY